MTRRNQNFVSRKGLEQLYNFNLRSSMSCNNDDIKVCNYKFINLKINSTQFNVVFPVLHRVPVDEVFLHLLNKYGKTQCLVPGTETLFGVPCHQLSTNEFKTVRKILQTTIKSTRLRSRNFSFAIRV